MTDPRDLPDPRPASAADWAALPASRVPPHPPAPVSGGYAPEQPPPAAAPGGRRRRGVSRTVLVAGVAGVVALVAAGGLVAVLTTRTTTPKAAASIASAQTESLEPSASQSSPGSDVDWTKQEYPYILEGAYQTTNFDADGSLSEEFSGNWVAAHVEGETTGVLAGIPDPVVVAIVRVGTGTFGERVGPPGERVFVWRVGSAGNPELLATGAWENSLYFSQPSGGQHGYSVETHFAIVNGLLTQYDLVVDALDPTVAGSWAVTVWSVTALADVNPYGPATLTSRMSAGDLTYPANDPAIPALATSGTPNQLAIPSAPTTAPSAGTTSGQPVTVSGGMGGPYHAVLFGQDRITDCAAHAYGAQVTAFLTSYPCTGARRVLATITVGGRVAALTATAVEFPPTGGDTYGYDTAVSFQELVTTEGTGNISDLLREGDRLPSSVTSVPDHVAFLATGQDAGVWIFESWWLTGTTADQDPALLEMENGLFLSDLFAY